MARILMVGGYLPEDPRVGGGQLISYQLAQTLVQKGHRIEYSAIPPQNRIPHPIPRSVRFRRRGAINEIIKAFRSRGGEYDLIHIHAGNDTWGTCLGYGLHRNKGRLVLSLYIPEVHRVPRSPSEIAQMVAARRADLVFALSHYSKKNIAGAWGIPLSKIEVIYAGVESAFFSDPPVSMELPRTILFVGRLDGPGRQKGLDTLLRALPLILKRHDIRLHVIGTGPGEGYFREQASRLQIDHNVLFFGFIPHAELPGYYHRAALLALPSRRESFGLVLAEAMAAGIPVVSTRVGAVPEVVVDGETGTLIPPDDPAACASAINALLDDPARMRKMGQKGRKRAEDLFTWEKVAARVEACYERVLGFRDMTASS